MVVILGPYGLNLGAGMTGGQAYVFDPDERMERHLNGQLVAAVRLEDADAATLRELLERHVALTGSARGGELLARFEDVVAQFWRVAPKAEVARIESAAEGTVAPASAIRTQAGRTVGLDCPARRTRARRRVLCSVSCLRRPLRPRA